MFKTINLLVLSPININSSESTKEKFVKIIMEEDRKMGNSSIINIGMQFIFRNQQRHIL